MRIEIEAKQVIADTYNFAECVYSIGRTFLIEETDSPTGENNRLRWTGIDRSIGGMMC